MRSEHVDEGTGSGPTSVRTLDTEDARWVAASLAGDLGAFDRLIERYQRRAMAVSYRLLGNVEDAADVCQEAFLRAYRSLDSLDEPRRFAAWLMRIVSNLSLNHRRSRRSTLSLVTDDAGEGKTFGAGPMGDAKARSPGEAAMTAELEKAIGSAVESLPEKQRLALVMFAMEGMPQKEVAEILEISVEAVKWHVFQARKILKERLSEFLVE